MPDLFARLAERTLGLAPVARPLTPPIFAPAPAIELDHFAPVEQGASRAVDDRRDPVPARPAPIVRSPAQVVAAATPEFTPAAKRSGDLRLIAQEAGPTTPIRRQIPTELVAEQRAWQPSVETSPDVASVRETFTPVTGMRTQEAGQPAPITETRTEFGVEEQSRRRVERSLDAADTSVRATTPTHPPVSRLTKRQERTDTNQGHAESVVEVNIGRIEVRAIFPKPQPMAPVRRASDSALSLADYLKERDRGLR